MCYDINERNERWHFSEPDTRTQYVRLLSHLVTASFFALAYSIQFKINLGTRSMNFLHEAVIRETNVAAVFFLRSTASHVKCLQSVKANSGV